jgi:phosphatidylserine decarboxylase
VVWAVLVDLGLLLLGRRSGWLALGTTAVCALFFRDPERPPCEGDDLVWAAADGVVTEVQPAEDPWLDEEATRVSTFLSLHNVHVTRSPVGGRIVLSEDIEGRFRPALFKKSEDNRRTRLAIDGKSDRVVVVQIAGMVARKITSWVRISGTVGPGERLGLIHFGSRTDVLLPRNRYDVLVRRGDRVRGGVSVLARRRLDGVAA